MTLPLRISGVSERDMDLLLLEEFIASERFRGWFLEKVLGPKHGLKELVLAARSIKDSTGESDLEIAFRDPSGSTVRFLIENKLSAGLQPKQAERYMKRARSYEQNKESARCHIVIIAPKRYFGDVGNKKGFDHRIDYEELLDWFAYRKELGDRQGYKLALIRAAIDKGTLGYQPVEDAPVTDLWRSYWLFAREHAPELEMKEPSGTPSKSSFVYFKPPSLPKGIDICHKLAKGYVDLQVRGAGDKVNELHHVLGKRLPPGMKLKRASGSAAIRIDAPILDLKRPFGEQTEEAQTGIAAAKRLLKWALKNQALLVECVKKTRDHK